VVAGLITCVTDDETGVRQRIGTRYALAGQVAEYRAVLDREGAAGPGDVVVAGDERAVGRQLGRLRDAGVTDLLAVPYGTDDEQRRTLELLAAT
jgi:hypothetical protein